MNLDSFKYLASFNFAEHFGIVAHTIELDNSHWKTDQILDCIDRGFRSIKWTYCDDNAVIVKADEEICLCETHSKELGLSSKEVPNIERIINEFKFGVKNMEKYLVFLQERIQFIKLDRFKVLIGKIIKDIEDSNDRLIYMFQNIETKNPLQIKHNICSIEK